MFLAEELESGAPCSRTLSRVIPVPRRTFPGKLIEKWYRRDDYLGHWFARTNFKYVFCFMVK